MLDVREAREEDYEKIVGYFCDADESYLHGMGVDPALLPDRTTWINRILQSHHAPDKEKEIFYLIWIVHDRPIGHSNINKIIYGKEAYMHLHMWETVDRKNGYGFELLKRCVPVYFDRFKLETLFCEPYALNPGPNHMLPKLGFDFVTQYQTRPGLICFEQPVNRWQLTWDKFVAR